ncbi:hypothetical protein [Actinomadura decatromicini]|uniref:Uncharacterized protein n=1 Tax=Actinomadura decatromicini TaxID=2604572 RepID=A0A5D3G0E1_9ACTN|nr:hypothetical protein [Actinomadura decatromicini]TYK52925.1 hypothetical protein FXF68_04025 [Actinomadura decatromicini]
MINWGVVSGDLLGNVGKGGRELYSRFVIMKKKDMAGFNDQCHGNLGIQDDRRRVVDLGLDAWG